VALTFYIADSVVLCRSVAPWLLLTGLCVAQSSIRITSGVINTDYPATHFNDDAIKGVEIKFTYDDSDITQGWKDRDVVVAPYSTACEVSKSIYEKMIRAELAKYNSIGVKKCLKAVILVDTIAIAGVAVGGTCTSDTLWITTRDAREKLHDESQICSIFHHELATVIVWNSGEEGWEFKREWISKVGGESKYQGGSFIAMKADKASTSFDPCLLEHGFLCEYSTATFDDDVSMLNEKWMMSRPLVNSAIEVSLQPSATHGSGSVGSEPVAA